MPTPLMLHYSALVMLANKPNQSQKQYQLIYTNMEK
jgi:hypothetical protein